MAATIEIALSKPLTDAGFSIRRNSDEDTYVYVNVMTSSGPNGTCVSRYDAFLYTHATAKLAHTTMPVLVQVSLLHDGGIGHEDFDVYTVARAILIDYVVGLLRHPARVDGKDADAGIDLMRHVD